MDIALPLGPPIPENGAEAFRVQHSRLRRRILYSQHKNDVKKRLVQSVGSKRAEKWGMDPDMTSNPAWTVCTQLAALYRKAPDVMAPAGGDDASAAIAEAGFWQLAQRNQRDTIGLNNMLVRVDIDEDDGPAFQLAHPDLVEVKAHPLRPSKLLQVKHWVQDPRDAEKWVRLEVEPAKRRYQAFDEDDAEVTREVLEGDSFSGDSYPWMVEGNAVMPYVSYRAAETGYALDPYTGSEVFEGALQLGVYYSFFGHILRNAAWAQRWALGVEPLGASTSADGKRSEVTADPATLLLFKLLEGFEGQPTMGQFNTPVDPDQVLKAVERYERRLVDMALGAVGVSRRESDVRSAMSLAVSREAQREAQASYEPMFRRSDLQLLRLVSGLMGGPTAGWRINYFSIPKDAAEIRAEMEQMAGLIEAGLMSRVEAYQKLHLGLTREEAQAALALIESDNRQAA